MADAQREQVAMKTDAPRKPLASLPKVVSEPAIEELRPSASEIRAYRDLVAWCERSAGSELVVGEPSRR
jgi:hypothetical protein